MVPFVESHTGSGTRRASDQQASALRLRRRERDGIEDQYLQLAAVAALLKNDSAVGREAVRQRDQALRRLAELTVWLEEDAGVRGYRP